MARSKIVYTSEFAYHICARANNKEFFPIPRLECWEIFTYVFKESQKRFGFKNHGFSMMSNHYHTMVSCSSNANLGVVMNWVQNRISREVNKNAGKINHFFGGPYVPTLIQRPEDYAEILKYIYRNPVKAGMCERVEDYSFSTFAPKNILLKESIVDARSGLILSRPPSALDSQIQLYSEAGLVEWMNIPHPAEQNDAIRKALKRRNFNLRSSEKSRTRKK